MVKKEYCDVCGKYTEDVGIHIKLLREAVQTNETESLIEDVDYDLCWDCNDAILRFIEERGVSLIRE